MTIGPAPNFHVPGTESTTVHLATTVVALLLSAQLRIIKIQESTNHIPWYVSPPKLMLVFAAAKLSLELFPPTYAGLTTNYD